MRAQGAAARDARHARSRASSTRTPLSYAPPGRPSPLWWTINLAQAVTEVQQLVASCERLAALMEAMGHVEGPSDAALGSLFGGLAGGVKQSETLAIYRKIRSDQIRSDQTR